MSNSTTKIKLTLKASVLSVIFISILIFWFYIHVVGSIDTDLNYSFGLLMALIPLFSGICGFVIARKWGGLGSVMGKAVVFFSIGLLTWSIGTLIFAYYNLVLGIEVPYPSVADVSYLLTTPFWATGTIYLSKAIGATFSVRTLYGKITLILIPLVTIVVSYYLLFIFARGGMVDLTGGLKVFFDILYPVESIVMLSLTALTYSLSYKYLGGHYKVPCLLLMTGFALNYVADFSFAYTTTAETFYVANWVDLLFATTMFLLSFGLLQFDASIIHKET